MIPSLRLVNHDANDANDGCWLFGVLNPLLFPLGGMGFSLGIPLGGGGRSLSSVDVEGLRVRLFKCGSVMRLRRWVLGCRRGRWLLLG